MKHYCQRNSFAPFLFCDKNLGQQLSLSAATVAASNFQAEVDVLTIIVVFPSENLLGGSINGGTLKWMLHMEKPING